VGGTPDGPRPARTRQRLRERLRGPQGRFGRGPVEVSRLGPGGGEGWAASPPHPTRNRPGRSSDRTAAERTADQSPTGRPASVLAALGARQQRGDVEVLAAVQCRSSPAGRTLEPAGVGLRTCLKTPLGAQAGAAGSGRAPTMAKPAPTIGEIGNTPPTLRCPMRYRSIREAAWGAASTCRARRAGDPTFPTAVYPGPGTVTPTDGQQS
jgi:hypothetical protein